MRAENKKEREQKDIFKVDNKKQQLNQAVKK